MSRGTPTRVVVVHHDQPEDCLATIASLRRSTLPVSVTVVDNASDRASRATLARGLERFDPSEVEVLEAPENLGFGPGANLGLQRFLYDPSDGDWVFVAPHDIEVAPGTLARVLDAASTVANAGLCCADVGDAMVPVFDPYFGGMVVPGGDEPGWEPVDYPHGTLMALRRDCLAEVGMFDERYFSYCEEADLGMRARNRGWEVGLVRGAPVRNRNLGSPVAVVDELQTRNTLLLVREHSGRYHAFIRICFTLVQVARGVLSPATRPAVFDPRARLRGVQDFLRGRFGPPGHRR
ncbi:MAG: glycosyltransferase [Microthrixaceae bacterium]|nr:glycosyltransferase [Microthrixaceae bacterium]